jgi:toxin CcdB
VQNDYIDGLATRVVIPLRPARVFGARAERLHPLVKVRAEEMVLDTAAMGAVPRSELRAAIGSLKTFQPKSGSCREAMT